MEHSANFDKTGVIVDLPRRTDQRRIRARILGTFAEEYLARRGAETQPHHAQFLVENLQRNLYDVVTKTWDDASEQCIAGSTRAECVPFCSV